MRIAICDDEKEVQRVLSGLIRNLVSDEEIVFYDSGEELLSDGRHLDILFLDIQMSGMNGMDAARKFRESGKQTVLIFITALEEYVFQAFDVGAFHYLVKPFSEERFAEIFHLAWEQAESQADGASRGEKDACLWVKAGGVSTKIRFADIVYAEVFGRKITIHKPDGEVEYYGKMAELEKEAGDMFFRSHRSYLVNYQYITKYDAAAIETEYGTVLLSKKKYSEFVRGYMKYVAENGGTEWQTQKFSGK